MPGSQDGTAIIPALERQRLGNQPFKASLDYMVNSKPTKTKTKGMLYKEAFKNLKLLSGSVGQQQKNPN